MARILLFSDIHIHNHKKSYDRLNDCLKALQWVFDTAKKENIKSIIFGGDILHERQKIDIFVYNQIYNILSCNLKGSGINFYCLLGNHDLWFNENTSISGVYPFQSIEGFKVVSNPETIVVDNSTWDFLPFTHDPLDSMKSFSNDKLNEKYLIGHISIDGAVLNSSGNISDVIIEHDGEMVKISKDIFLHYKHSFFGHYHQGQALAKNVEYIGSPLELSFGESGEQKHIIILDTDKNEKKYVINDFSPRHIYIYENEIEKIKTDKLKNNFVCLLSTDVSSFKTKEFSDFIKENCDILSFQIKSVSVKDETTSLDKTIIEDAKSLMLNDEKLISMYVEKQDIKSLDKTILAEIGNKIIKLMSEKVND